MPIATHEAYAEMLDRAKSGAFAYPAINVTSSQTLNAAIRGFAEAESDGIVQVSTGGAAYWSGASTKDMVAGSLGFAAFAREVAKNYGVNIALHTDHCPKDKLEGFVLPLLAPDARVMLAGMALDLAGLEALVLRPGRKPVEPTHSLGAFALVLLALQVTDPVRFVVFAVGVGTAAPIPAAIGGAVASAVLLAAAISLPDLAESAGLRLARRGVGAVLLLIGLWLAWGALP